MILGTVNGVNFTDGLDGLAASVTILNAVFFSVASIGLETVFRPRLRLSGVCWGFWYSMYFLPASLWAIPEVWHSAVSSREWRVSYVSLISAACGIHLYDGDSLCDPAGVILQTDEGKRIFKMTPIHHHFELMGWSETQIVTVFATITAILCLIALMGL